MNKGTLSMVTDERPTTIERLRVVAVRRFEELLAELPATARSLRTLLKVLAVTIPVLGVALIVVLWHFASR